MEYFTISLFLNAFTSAACCLFVILGNPKSHISRSFCYFTFCLTVWASFYFLWAIATNKNDALLFTRCLNNTALFIPVTFLHFCASLTNTYKKYSRLIKIIYLINCSFLCIGFTRFFIVDVNQIYIFKFWPIAGKLFIYLLLEYLFITGLSFLLLYRKMRLTKGLEHKQLKFVFYGILIAYLGGATNYPLFYGIPFPPLGNSLVILYTVSITYAIFKYQLMDIKVALKRSLIYTVLISFITIFYLILIYFTEHVVKELLGYQSLFISIGAATILALVFTPLKNTIQSFIEQNLFRGSYTQIAEENELLRQEIIQTERLKAVATLASGMAHEIKNPLTVIKTFSEYLPQKLEDKAFLRKFAPMIAQEVERIDNLVHELLDFAKPANPILKPVNIHHLIDSTIEFLSNDCLRYQIKIYKNYSISSEVCTLLDQNQIKQALLNIFLNSIEAMKNGGRLDISTCFNIDQTSMNIKVQDTGVGITSQDLQHIFDPFFTKKDNGTGLGLSITHEIIKKHGGKIFVESFPGKGTTFILELPFLK